MKRAALLALICAACADDLAFLSSEGLSTVILVEVGAETRATAYDVTDGKRLRREAPVRGDTYALGYALAPLAPGPLTLVATGEPLPMATQHHRLDGAEWTALAAPPAELSALRMQPIDNCLDFSLRTLTIPTEPMESATIALALDEERVFMATSFGRFFIVTADEVMPLTTLSTTTPHQAGAIVEGEVWLAGPGDVFAHGHPDRGFTDGPKLPFGVGLDASLDGPTKGAPFELFVTDTNLAVARFDGTRWTTIAPGRPIGRGSIRASMAWLEPGVVGLLGTGTSSIVEISEDGSERAIEIPLTLIGDLDALWTIEHIEGIGGVVGTKYLVMYERRLGAWIGRPSQNVTPRASVIIDMGGGIFIAGGTDGQFVQWGPGERDVCPALGAIGASTHAAARLGTGFVAFSGMVNTRIEAIIASSR